MRRRDALRLLGGGAVAGGFTTPAAAHPTPAGTDADGTPVPRVDAGYGPLGWVDLQGATEAVVSPDGTTAFVALDSGYAVVDVSRPTEPTVLAERRGIAVGRDLLAADLGETFDSITDLAHDGDTLVVAGDGTPSGLLVVDVSDHDSPEHRAFHRTEYGIHNCDVEDGRAYLTVDYSGGRLDIVDVTGEPTRVGDWTLAEQDSAWRDVPDLARDVHDAFVQDGTAYLAHWDAGTWLVDVSEPSATTAIAHLGRSAEAVAAAHEADEDTTAALPGNAHYAAVDDEATLLAIGREASASEERPDGGPGGIDLYDVSDPTDPQHRSTVDPPADPDGPGGRWTTAHNFELRDGILYSSWYNGGVKRHDVSDPAAPRQLTWWADPAHAEFWTAQAAVPGGSFVASSRGTGRSPARLYTFPDREGKTAWGYDVGVPEDLPTRQPSKPSSGVSAPGFGLLSAVAGVGAGALAWLHGRNRE